MKELSPFILGSCITILFLEVVMWELFRRKIAGICFEEGADTPFFRFFTIAHVALMITLHAVALMTIVGITFWFLW